MVTVAGPSDVPFMDRFWYQAWFDHLAVPAGWSGPLFGPDSDGCYVPLAWFRKSGLRFACLAGSYGPFRDIGILNPGALKRCAESLEEDGVGAALRLGPVKECSSNAAALVRFLRQRRWHVAVDHISNEFVVDWSSGGFEGYWGAVSSDLRRKINKYMCRMEANGPVDFVRHVGIEAQEGPRVFADLAQVESRSWVAARGEPRFLGAANQAYWCALLESQSFRRALRVWFLCLAERPVAFEVALDGESKRYSIAGSYDQEFASFRPGTVLLTRVLRDTDEDGFQQFDFGMGDGGYKSALGAKPVERVVDFLCFPPTGVGRLLYWLFRARAAVQAQRRLAAAAIRQWRAPPAT